MLPPFFMPAKREACGALTAAMFSLCSGGRPLLWTKGAPSPRPLLAKKLFSGPVLCPAIDL